MSVKNKQTEKFVHAKEIGERFDIEFPEHENGKIDQEALYQILEEKYSLTWWDKGFVWVHSEKISENHIRICGTKQAEVEAQAEWIYQNPQFGFVEMDRKVISRPDGKKELRLYLGRK